MGMTMELAALLTILTLLIAVSALGGALWSHSRSLPRVRALRLAEQLAALLPTVELLVARLENAKPAAIEPENRVPASASLRVDRPAATALRGPTLIAVPDLARSTTSSPNQEFAEELARRFSNVWALADAGQTTEAIARQTGQPSGHIELILGLRGRIGQNRAPRSSAGGGS